MPSAGEVAKSAALGGGLAAIFVAIIIIMSLAWTPIAGTVVAALPSTLLMYAIAATVSKNPEEEDRFRETLTSTSIFYILLTAVTGMWAGLDKYYEKKKNWTDWRKRTWASFGWSFGLWSLFTVIIVVLYCKIDTVHKFFANGKPLPVSQKQ